MGCKNSKEDEAAITRVETNKPSTSLENSLPKSYKLNNGTTIPSVGLGSLGNKDVANLTAIIMEAGYIHIDTA